MVDQKVILERKIKAETDLLDSMVSEQLELLVKFQYEQSYLKRNEIMREATERKSSITRTENMITKWQNQLKNLK